MLQHFTVGSFTIHTYGPIVALAILLGFGVAYTLAGKEDQYKEHLIDVILYGFIGAIIGARLWQVFFYDWNYYSENILELVMVWRGGLAIQGGIVGAVIAGYIYSRCKKLDFWQLSDIAAPGLIFGQAIGRIACFLNGDAYGKPTGSDFGIVYPPGTPAYDSYESQPLWPAEVWEGQLNFLIFALILIVSRINGIPRGFVFLCYIVLYAANRFILEYFRGDGIKYFLDLTGGQWTSIGMITISVALGLKILLQTKIKVSNK